MTNTRLYAAVTVKENGKYYAYMIPFSTNDNAMRKLRPTFKSETMVEARIFTRRWECEEHIHELRRAFLEKGTAMFGVF